MGFGNAHICLMYQATQTQHPGLISAQCQPADDEIFHLQLPLLICNLACTASFAFRTQCSSKLTSLIPIDFQHSQLRLQLHECEGVQDCTSVCLQSVFVACLWARQRK